MDTHEILFSTQQFNEVIEEQTEVAWVEFVAHEKSIIRSVDSTRDLQAPFSFNLK